MPETPLERGAKWAVCSPWCRQRLRYDLVSKQQQRHSTGGQDKNFLPKTATHKEVATWSGEKYIIPFPNKSSSVDKHESVI